MVIAINSGSSSGLSLLLGLYRGGRFSYGRALLSSSIRFSVVLEDIARDLGCLERIEGLGEVVFEISGLGRFVVTGVCSVDRIVFGGYYIDLPIVFHVARQVTGERLYEIFIGRELIEQLGISYDPWAKSIRSRFIKRVSLDTLI